MQAAPKEIATLLQLQELDMGLLRAKKKLDELPQRERILALRAKMQEVEKQLDQIQEMRKEVDRGLTQINDEDARLTQKQEEVQKKIDLAQGDYRAVESLTKELGGIAKRRNTLETDLVPLAEKSNKISAVQKQVEEAFALLKRQEAESIVSFQEEGGALTNEVAQLQAGRNASAAKLDASLLDVYQKKMQRLGGIAVARLQGDTCSVCRNHIDGGKLLQLQAEAPLSECPTCKRMMVIIDA